MTAPTLVRHMKGYRFRVRQSHPHSSESDYGLEPANLAYGSSSFRLLRCRPVIGHRDGSPTSFALQIHDDSFHTNHDAVHGQRIAGRALQFRDRFVQIRLRA